MTPADEQAIEYTELSIQLSAIFERAAREAQDALQARRNACRRTEDWESVAKDQRDEITALEQEIATLVNDLGIAMAAMQAYREHAADMDSVQVGAEQLLAALRDLERRQQSGTPAEAVARLYQDLAKAQARIADLVEMPLSRLGQTERAEQAAAHFYHCRQCIEGPSCEEGERYARALGLIHEK
jgi:hypothetical protein